MVLGQGHRIFGENRIQEAQSKWPAFKEKYKDVEPVVFQKLNKCVLYSLEELKKLGYIPSSETFVELAQPMEAFLQTIDFDFKEDITVEEHLKYLLYKSFKNMRSLLLLNLESQLKINEIPQLLEKHGITSINIEKTVKDIRSKQ